MTSNTASATRTPADRRWFAERVEVLLPELYGTAVRLCRDRTDAEDLVAETVAKGWTALPSLENRDSLRAWLFRILNNSFISRARSAEAQAEYEVYDTAQPEHFSLFERLHQPMLLWWGNPELRFLNRLLREDIERAIEDLPDVYRTVVVMVDVQGLRYSEAAELLEVPIGTVRSRLARGRSMLQQALWHHASDAGLTGEPEHAPDETDDDD